MIPQPRRPLLRLLMRLSPLAVFGLLFILPEPWHWLGLLAFPASLILNPTGCAFGGACAAEPIAGDADRPARTRTDAGAPRASGL